MRKPEEIIENYLTNKLSSSEREAFENQLASDAGLKSQTEFQSAIVESLKKARVAQLKANLNNVKIETPILISPQAKIAASVAIISGFILLFYFFSKDTELATTIVKEPAIENTLIQQAKPSQERKIDKPISGTITPDNPVSSNKTIKPVVDQSAKATRTPIQPIDPTQEFESNSPLEQSSEIVERNKVSIANIVAETDSSDKKYTFHYKFHKGKLILYGSFDKSLYEILEINGENRTVFLFYKDSYYLLDENQTKIKMLEPIQDKTLIERLNVYRLSKK